MTDAQILSAIKKLTPRERAAVAVDAGIAERTIHRWKAGLPKKGINRVVRAALVSALSEKKVKPAVKGMRGDAPW